MIDPLTGPAPHDQRVLEELRAVARSTRLLLAWVIVAIAVFVVAAVIWFTLYVHQQNQLEQLQNAGSGHGSGAVSERVGIRR